MQLKLILDIEAQKEYIESYLHYEREQKDLGKRFIDAVENLLNYILRHPLHFPKKRKEYREAVLRSFPFVIVYEILSARDLIYIAAIFHTSRNPKLKYRKLKQ